MIEKGWGRITVNIIIAPAAKTDAVANIERENPEVYHAFEEQFPMGRYGDADQDIAPVAVFLAGEASDYMTGQTFNVDGGLFLAP